MGQSKWLIAIEKKLGWTLQLIERSKYVPNRGLEICMCFCVIGLRLPPMDQGDSFVFIYKV
jgi:hypothetical protein